MIDKYVKVIGAFVIILCITFSESINIFQYSFIVPLMLGVSIASYYIHEFTLTFLLLALTIIVFSTQQKNKAARSRQIYNTN